jgi:flagellar hook-length control protein FliK
LALPLLLIGEAVAHGLLGHNGSASAKSGLGNLLGDVSFGSQLRKKLGSNATDQSDPLAQLAAMLQSGTPLSTITNRIAQQLSGALANATGDGANAERQRTLQQALASALAPPGTSPPTQGRTAEVLSLSKGASLEIKLQNLLGAITRELNDAGQQSRFSGAILDANSAKEIPAQQQTNPHAGIPQAPASLSLAASILQNVVQQLQGAAQNAPQNAAQPAHLTAQQPPVIPQITVQSPDVLGRMLARAATAETQRTAMDNGARVSGAPAPSPLAPAPVPPPSNGLDPSQLFARLLNVIAQSSNEHTPSGGQREPSQFTSGKDSLPSTPSAPSNTQTLSAPAFAAALTNASAPAAPSAVTAMAPYTVDPQSVIDQVVKGIVLRNFGTTSEVRMRLQPEHLGDVSLKLTVSGSTISANIVAQNADVRDMLLSNQQQLARTLAEAGLSLGNFSVDVSGGNAGFSQQQSAQHRAFGKTSALHVGAVAEDDTWTDSRFGPPLLAGSNPLVLNYLA